MREIGERIRNRVVSFETEHFHGAVTESSDGRVTVMLHPKSKTESFSVMRIRDGRGGNMVYTPFHCGQELSVTWRAHEPFDWPINIPAFDTSDTPPDTDKG